jgi:thiol:disulfide interchange protein DsbA
MKARRAFIVLAASLLGASFVAAATASAADPAAPAAAGKWRQGANYRPVPNPQPPTVPAGKIEVAEVFWYGCNHCFALDPVLEQWNTSKAPYIEFVRVPVVWGPVHRQHAKLYYTLQALRRPELHAKAFETIHVEGVPLSSPDEVKARAMHFAFVSRHGVNAQQFDAAYDSMMVAMSVQRAEAFTRNQRVDNVPSLYVHGKYVTTVSEAGGETQLLALINHLAAGEKR